MHLVLVMHLLTMSYTHIAMTEINNEKTAIGSILYIYFLKHGVTKAGKNTAMEKRFLWLTMNKLCRERKHSNEHRIASAL